ncbi:uncharacterized protein LOC143194006 isoform X2 [Rhynchophorus ferrugineus]|uniref:uncharacterized protein LOC143194006 isoform X2 n=1 Tax=Rhynchophorus ferrugineus TaxID=354439 RepID=UPI003FCDCB55
MSDKYNFSTNMLERKLTLPDSGPKRKLTDSNVQSDGAKSTIKRRFPGPAGILPDDEMEYCNNVQCAQMLLQEGPWKEMSKDFKINNALYLYDKFNIAWIKKEAAANNFIKQKAPFLAAVLHSIEIADGQKQKCANVMLKDATGRIQGTIQYSLYKDYLSKLVVGSVLVIVNFGVLSCTCEQCDNHHLTIVSKNLCVIYSTNEKISIVKVDPDDILKNYYKNRKELENDKRKSDHLKFTMNNISSAVNTQCFNRYTSHFPKCISQLAENHKYEDIKNRNPISIVMSPLRTHNSEKKLNISTDTFAKKTNFNFKKLNVNNSETDENKKICKDLLDGIDINSLFEEF